MILLLASLLILRSAAAADVGYFWHVSDFHLDPRYGSNVTRAGARDIFLGDYDEVSMSCTVMQRWLLSISIGRDAGQSRDTPWETTTVTPP